MRRPALNVRKSLHAFTLVELLVVIGIIALLISILLPSLNNARKEAKKVQCLSNLRQIGIAMLSYTNENNGSFPVHGNWGDLMGKKGTSTIYDITGTTGMATDNGIASERPLNKYLNTADAFRCPDDIGDTLQSGVFSCFESYGTSYLVQWNSTVFGVNYVTTNNATNKPLKIGTFKNPTGKIVLGDWNWHINRLLTAPRTSWHYKPKQGMPRRMNMLFADGHAQDFMFPTTFEQNQAPNPDGEYW